MSTVNSQQKYCNDSSEFQIFTLWGIRTCVQESSLRKTTRTSPRAIWHVDGGVKHPVCRNPCFASLDGPPNVCVVLRRSNNFVVCSPVSVMPETQSLRSRAAFSPKISFR